MNPISITALQNEIHSYFQILVQKNFLALLRGEEFFFFMLRY